MSAATTGGDPDSEYRVFIDGADAGTFDADNSLVVTGVGVDRPSVGLGDVAQNCTVAGENPREVLVISGDTVSTVFDVACAPTGVRVTLAMTGLDPDPNYLLTVDGGHSIPVSWNTGSVTLSRLQPGLHYVGASGLTDNCSVVGENPRPFQVEWGELTPVALEIGCLSAVGAIEVRTRTTGVDLDPDGYAVLIALNGWFLAPNDTVVAELIQGGEQPVEISGVAPNCAVQGDVARTVFVAVGGVTRDTARTLFDVVCSPVSVAENAEP